MYCGSCGTETLNTHQFCGVCGTALTESARLKAADANAAPMSSSDQALLEEISGRVETLEARDPRTMILSRSFPRSFGILGHHFAAMLPLYLLPLLFGTLVLPTLLRSNRASNETAAVETLHIVGEAQEKYYSSKGRYGSLQELVTSRLLDQSFLQVKTGYRIALNLESDNYAAAAIPTSASTGRYVFYITREGVVRYSNEKADAPPNLAGKPIR
jgi:hypothetical protein